MENRFEERYRSGDTPWDHGVPDFNLINTVNDFPIHSCRALDIGCGTGDNAVWLAKQGFTVTGCDIAPTAIETAGRKAGDARVNCTFLTADFMADHIPGGPFGFAFDRGCLHSIDDLKQRSMFAARVVSLLEPAGIWLTLAGNADEPEREVGPPQMTAAELVAVAEPEFEILSLESGRFGSNQADPPRAWICLLRKRKCVN